jgi:hypothetical protein
MSKGKELQYSVNRSFEKIKLPLLGNVRISVYNSQHERSDILFTSDYDSAEARCNDRILTDVSDRELIKVNFSVTSYSTLEQKLG